MSATTREIQFITNAVKTYEAMARKSRKTERDHPESAEDIVFCEQQAAVGRELLKELGTHGH